MPINSPAPHSVLIGGSKGLGRVVAERFAALGHQVSIVSRSPLAESLTKLPNVKWFGADLADRASIEKTAQTITSERGPVNNLVFFQRARLPSQTPEQNWDNEFQISVKASHAAIEAMKTRFVPDGGSIVFISSRGGSSFADSQPLEYGLVKASIDQMVRHYCVLLGARQIRVNAVSCFTFLKDESKDFFLKNEDLQKAIKNTVPLQRMATAVDMARAVAFLCSEEAAFVSGQTLLVDGGLSAVGQETIAFWASGVRERPL